MVAQFVKVFADSLPAGVACDMLAHLLRAADASDHMCEMAAALGQVYSAPAFVEPTLRFFNRVLDTISSSGPTEEPGSSIIGAIAESPLRTFALHFLVPAYCGQAHHGREFALSAASALQLAEALFFKASDISTDLPHMLLPMLDALRPADPGVTADKIVGAAVLDLLTSVIHGESGRSLTSMQTAVQICEPMPAVSITNGPLRTGAALEPHVLWAAVGKLLGAAILYGVGELGATCGVFFITEHKLLRYSCPLVGLDADSAEHIRSQLLNGLGYAQQFPAYQHAFLPFQLRAIQETSAKDAQSRHVLSHRVGVDSSLWVPKATLRFARELIKLEVGGEVLRGVAPRELMRAQAAGCDAAVNSNAEMDCPSFLNAFRQILDGYGAPDAIGSELASLCGDATTNSYRSLKEVTLAKLAAADVGTTTQLLRARIDSVKPFGDAAMGAPKIKLRIMDAVDSRKLDAQVFVDVDANDARNRPALQAMERNCAKGTPVLLRSVVIRHKDAQVLALELRRCAS